ncbi:YjaG family protein [Thalassotalea montiporae]
MAIRLPLAKLSLWQQTAFCCALLERMLPNYAMFSQAAEFGDVNVLRNQLDLIWQRLDSKQKVKLNFDAQLEKLEEQIPDPEAFDFFGVFPALDVCMALMSLLQALQSKDAQEFANVSRLSHNSVSYYVELLLVEESDDADDELSISQQQLNQHPLMEWELATQNELFDFLKQAPENKNTCQQAKAMVLEEGLSNLGIEIT